MHTLKPYRSIIGLEWMMLCKRWMPCLIADTERLVPLDSYNRLHLTFKHFALPHFILHPRARWLQINHYNTTSDWSSRKCHALHRGHRLYMSFTPNYPILSLVLCLWSVTLICPRDLGCVGIVGSCELDAFWKWLDNESTIWVPIATVQAKLFAQGQVSRLGSLGHFAYDEGLHLQYMPSFIVMIVLHSNSSLLLMSVLYLTVTHHAKSTDC